MARATKDWQFRGLEAVILENHCLRVTVLPGVGARIFQFVDKVGDRDLLWHHPRRFPEPAVLGSPGADLWWTGGIDDVFPTDFPCAYRNEQLPYLGELWSNEWDYSIEQAGGRFTEAVFRTRTVISPFEVEKRVSLSEADSHVTVRYTIRNIGFSDYDWFFGIHPGLEVEPGCRLLFPLRDAIIDDGWPAEVLAARGTRYTWPLCPAAGGRIIDLSEVPGPEAGWWTFHYGPEITRPWLAVYNTRQASAFCMAYDQAFFKSLLIYLGYGGWRNTYSIIPQIATAWPGDLAGAVAAGRQKTLKPAESVETEIKLICATEVSKKADLEIRLRDMIDLD